MAKEVKISDEVYQKIEKRAKEKGFSSVDEYVEEVLKELLKSIEEEQYSKEDEEKIKERLRDLGYID